MNFGHRGFFPKQQVSILRRLLSLVASEGSYLLIFLRFYVILDTVYAYLLLLLFEYIVVHAFEYNLTKILLSLLVLSLHNISSKFGVSHALRCARVMPEGAVN